MFLVICYQFKKLNKNNHLNTQTFLKSYTSQIRSKLLISLKTQIGHKRSSPQRTCKVDSQSTKFITEHENYKTSNEVWFFGNPLICILCVHPVFGSLQLTNWLLTFQHSLPSSTSQQDDSLFHHNLMVSLDYCILLFPQVIKVHNLYFPW